MGNLCSKSSSESDPFAQPGRTVGSVPTPSPNPRAATPKIASTGHILGSAKGGGADWTGEGRIDARSAAARAAEVCTCL